MATNKTKDQIRQENIEAQVSATEKFFEENKKTLFTVIIAAVVIGLGALAYVKFIYQPACAEASAAVYPAELSFQAGEYEIALNGDGVNAGFAEVIDNYGSKAGKAVYLYAGICELQLGNDESALSYLKRYKGTDKILAARAIALKGDAQANLGNTEAAAKLFVKAANKADNVFAAAYLLKAGIAYEALGNAAEALKCYTTIKDQYRSAIESYDIDKYIARAKASL